jgi:hypothetical protein
MNITWDSEPDTAEQRMVADYVRQSKSLIMAVLKLSAQHGLLTASFTPKPSGKRFFSYEIKYNHLIEAYHLIVWRGIRVGDAVPILYGVLERAKPP